MDAKNTLLDDIAAEIGYTPTAILSEWFGGEQLYIQVSPDARIAALIGDRNAERLSKAFGGTVLAVPKNKNLQHVAVLRVVYDKLRKGKSVADVAESICFSVRHVLNMRRELEEAGILPMVFKEPPC